MVGHDQMRIGRDLEAGGVDAAAPEPVELADQDARIDHDAVSDRARLARIEDPGRDQMELELVALADDRVAGVVAALEAHDDVGLLGNQVDDLALALIAPLGADYDNAWHGAGLWLGGQAIRLKPKRRASETLRSSGRFDPAGPTKGSDRPRRFEARRSAWLPPCVARRSRLPSGPCGRRSAASAA